MEVRNFLTRLDWLKNWVNRLPKVDHISVGNGDSSYWNQELGMPASLEVVASACLFNAANLAFRSPETSASG